MMDSKKSKKCICKRRIIKTNYCPDCGENQKTLPKRYAVDGHCLVNLLMAVKTDEFRKPKKGEYYLSGAKPIAYKALSDLPFEFWIAKIL